ncbi:MAG: hypothetical protein GF418_15975 [Chitinivibrionales bacterium]|nr:hypothetical protein [Chitinivibrionales bacterium]
MSHCRSLFMVKVDYRELARRVSERIGRVYEPKYIYDVHQRHCNSKFLRPIIDEILAHESYPTVPNAE